jgi:hypothetical protein
MVSVVHGDILHGPSAGVLGAPLLTVLFISHKCLYVVPYVTPMAQAS